MRKGFLWFLVILLHLCGYVPIPVYVWDECTRSYKCDKMRTALFEIRGFLKHRISEIHF
jgi:hypothetical protein